jgi:CDP-paratose 2-epimerase
MSNVIIVTGSAGLIGSAAVRFFAEKGFDIVGVDNDMRAQFFGAAASTRPNLRQLASEVKHYFHYNIDIRDQLGVEALFRRGDKNIHAIVHCASQPSHDWAASDPHTDFGVNAVGTLNLLEATRRYCPEAPFVFMSSSKVYGDTPNKIMLEELDTRFDIPRGETQISEIGLWYSGDGINERMSIDQSLHSLFGVSKLSADLLVQEYGRYFGMKTVCFRPGCLTGPNHAGVEQHGFLSHLVKCAVSGAPYRIIGYGGKQVRDNIHSQDVVSAMWEFIRAPRSGVVYNLGGGRHSNCSILEAIADCERLTGKKMETSYVDTPRKGDHKFWIGDPRKWQSHYPNWTWTYDHERLITEMVEAEQAAK